MKMVPSNTNSSFFTEVDVIFVAAQVLENSLRGWSAWPVSWRKCPPGDMTGDWKRSGL